MMLRRFAALAVAVATLGMMGSAALAIPYASQVRNTTGNEWEFVLNQSADTITVLRDGANPFVISSPAAGRQTFDMTGFSSFEIQVDNSAAAGWTEITDTATNPFLNVFRATGIAVNRDASSPYFGTVYVNNPNPTSTALGRPNGDGIYAMSADMIGVDLANNFAVVTDPNDTSYWRAPNYTVSGSTTSASYRISLDDSGNVIVGDWSDQNGGIKWASADLTDGGLILGGFANIDPNDSTPLPEGGPTGGVFAQQADQFGRFPLHGSIVSRVYTTGTVGVDLTVWAMDEDLDAQRSWPGNDGNNIWRWDVGAATSYDALAPTLVVNSGLLGTDNDGDPHFLALNVGVLADIDYSPANNLWYMVQQRADGNENGLVIVEPLGDQDGNATVMFSSHDFTLANGLDGLPDNPANTATLGVQDIFRRIGGVVLSPDGTQLLLIKTVQTSSPQTTTGTNLGGRVIVIDLDENGLPAISVNDNGTPGDVSDDFIEGATSFAPEALGSTGFGLGTDFDAAGNVYHGNNINEFVRAFSPGGNTRAITTSSGMFSVEELLITALAGDFNGDGMVDAADYALWRDNVGNDESAFAMGTGSGDNLIDSTDYDLWRGNFGATSGAGSLASGAVPEPSSLAIVAGLIGLLALRRRVG